MSDPWMSESSDVSGSPRGLLGLRMMSTEIRPGIPPLEGHYSEGGIQGELLVGEAASAGYNASVAGIQSCAVSRSGRMPLPAAARRRWNLDNGGAVDVMDLGFAVLTLPQGDGSRLLSDLVGRDEHAALVRSLAEDPDLATT